MNWKKYIPKAQSCRNAGLEEKSQTFILSYQFLESSQANKNIFVICLEIGHRLNNVQNLYKSIYVKKYYDLNEKL